MTSILERFALEQSPLADLHLLADETGVDGFRRLRKPDLVDAIMARQSGDEEVERGVVEPEIEVDFDLAEPETIEAVPSAEADAEDEPKRSRRGRRGGRGRARREEGEGDGALVDHDEPVAATPDRGDHGDERVVEGVVELLANGSGFLRLAPPEPTDDDVYISAAQVKRCELVSGDRVSGPAARAAALGALPVADPGRHDQRRARPTRWPRARASRTCRSPGRTSASSSARTTRRSGRSSG